MTKPLLCLSMIVKDEARGIRETLESVRGVVDTWCILDTGSTDDTQAIIRETMADIPGRLIDGTFRDFSTTRNEALDLARDAAEWILLLNGDDEVTESDGLREFLDTSCDDWHDARILFGEIDFRHPRLLRSSAPARYVGETHEALVGIDAAPTAAPLEILHGAKVREDKTARWELDLQLLRRAATEDPGNPRTIFYLAQTLECLGNFEAAHWTYVARIPMGGFREEVYEAIYRSAWCASIAGWPRSYVESRLAEAHEMKPYRAEPLYRIGVGRLRLNLLDEAEPYLLAAFERTPPNDRLFFDRTVYEWRAAEALAELAIRRENFPLAERALSHALACPTLPNAQRLLLERWMAHVAKKQAA